MTSDEPGLQSMTSLVRLATRIRRSFDTASTLWFLLALVLVVLGSAAASLAPLVLKHLVDSVVTPVRDEPNVTILAPLIIAYVSALTFQRFCEEAQFFLYSKGEQRLVRRFSNANFAQIVRLPFAFHLNEKTGAVGQALDNASMGLRLILTHLVLTVAPVLIQIALAAAILSSSVGIEMSGILLVALTAYSLVFYWGVSRLHKTVNDISIAQGSAGGATADFLMNIETVKAFAAEARFIRRHDSFARLTEARFGDFSVRRLQNGLAVAIIFAISITGMLLMAGNSLTHGKLSIGAFVMVSTYLLQLLKPIETLGFAVREAGEGFGYLSRIAKILEQPPEPDLQDSPMHSADHAARLEFRDVSFSFGAEPTLSNVSFRAEPGRLVAIVGPSGAGKSSLMRLVLRFYEPTAGEILFDGEPVADLPLGTLRRQIALVAQDTILFNDTIRENVTIFEEKIEDRAVRDAVSKAQLSELLERLPQGLATEVGERGLKLSGGEKQRVSIARAALKDARLVIFDEATASLDPSTERAVWQAMRGVLNGATALVVTHRLSTIIDADEILVLERGHIVERGRHTELLGLGGLYTSLWKAQMAGAFVQDVRASTVGAETV